MKCTCGCEFEGKFCPNCGKRAEDNVVENNIQYQANQYQNQQVNYTQNQNASYDNSQQNTTYAGGNYENMPAQNMEYYNAQYGNQQYFNNQQNDNINPDLNTSMGQHVNPKEIVSGAVSDYRKFWFKRLSIGALVTAIIMFVMGMVVAGVLLAIGGIFTMPFVFKGSSEKKKKIAFAFGIICMILGIVEAITTPDRGELIIDYVKQYQEPGVYCSIGQYFGYIEDAGYDCTWTYKEDNGYEFVTVSYTDELGKNKIIFLIDDYPELYDVTINGVSDYYLYEEYNYRLFGE